MNYTITIDIPDELAAILKVMSGKPEVAAMAADMGAAGISVHRAEATPGPARQAVAPAVPAVTIDDLKRLVGHHGRDEAVRTELMAVLKKHGVVRLSETPDNLRAVIYREFEEIIHRHTTNA